MNDERNKDEATGSKENKAAKPDPETLHTTDPQEHMRGPVSSALREVGQPFDTNESKEEADREKDKNM